MLKPMLASLTDAPLVDPNFTYEPKYDGIRAIVEIPAGGSGVRLWSRLGNDKTREFDDVARALTRWARTRRDDLVLDGEVVALNERGEPAGFQHLQRRGPIAFIAFDLLRDGSADLRLRPLVERRAALERLFKKTGSPLLRISEFVVGDGRDLYSRALASGWEGLIAKRADSRYVSGKRSPDWRKLKIVHEQEFVIGGWTEPRHTRSHFGALLLGVYDPRRPNTLVYAGHVGTGFNDKELTRLMKLMKPLAITERPFSEKPPTNERPHWVKPTLVAEVKFTEWTADGLLRHPVYLGLRDDKQAVDVVREHASRVHASSQRTISSAASSSAPSGSAGSASLAAPRRKVPSGEAAATHSRAHQAQTDVAAVVDQLTNIERGAGDGIVELDGGAKLSVTNLRKIFWPKLKLTKGDLLRYYTRVSPLLLPAIADRPLVMKRYPNGVAEKPFYQHRAPEVPAGVRVEELKTGSERRPHIVGGDLLSLLYTTQLASISQDPWFSRVQSIQYADYVALDLDPPSDVPFTQVLDTARWIHEELEALGAVGVPKTSGADGLHVYLPLPPRTPYDAGLLLCQIIATVVVQKHPRHATIERSVNARGKRVYVDYLQNMQGKTLATAYSARANEQAGVSTPLTWKEVDAGVRREDFTIASAMDRFRSVGDLWSAVRRSKGIDLARLERYAKKNMK